MRTLALLEGGCALCGHVFAHPALGDHAYGEALLCSADGHHVVVASAFDPVPQRVAALLPAGADARFWPVLAALADRSGASRWCTACVARSVAERSCATTTAIAAGRRRWPTRDSSPRRP